MTAVLPPGPQPAPARDPAATLSDTALHRSPVPDDASDPPVLGPHAPSPHPPAFHLPALRVPGWQAPGFWTTGGMLARLLSPASPLVAAATRRRVARPGWQAPVPVLCCGNAVVGGAGKTTLALDLLARLRARGVDAHALTRGHGRRAGGGVLRVTDTTSHREAGDEALLLARCAPTWVCVDRAEAARAALAEGAELLVLDDGLQNSSLHQDCALLVIDGAAGFGNNRVLPAGPLREPVAAAAGRCRAAVLVGEDRLGALSLLPSGLPVLRASLHPGCGAAAVRGRRVLAFCGIARPSKFHATLAEAGAILAGTESFPDHHRFGAAELRRVLAHAQALDALPVTTPKDAVRLPPAVREQVHVVGVGLRWHGPDPLDLLG